MNHRPHMPRDLAAITEAAGRVLALPFTDGCRVPLSGLLNRVCMQCKGDMGQVPCVQAMDGGTSHGLHVECVAAFKAEWGAR